MDFENNPFFLGILRSTRPAVTMLLRYFPFPTLLVMLARPLLHVFVELLLAYSLMTFIKYEEMERGREGGRGGEEDNEKL